MRYTIFNTYRTISKFTHSQTNKHKKLDIHNFKHNYSHILNHKLKKQKEAHN